MKLAFDVGGTAVEFSRNWFTGRSTLTADGERQVLQSSLDPFTHFSVQLQRRWQCTVNGRQMRRVEMTVTRAKLKAAQAQEEIARVRPEIEKAIAEAKISEQAVKDAQPQIDEAWAKAGPEIDKALEQARVALAKANLDVKIQERVDQALKRVEIRIQARDGRHKNDDHDVVIEDSDAPSSK